MILRIVQGRGQGLCRFDRRAAKANPFGLIGFLSGVPAWSYGSEIETAAKHRMPS